MSRIKQDKVRKGGRRLISGGRKRERLGEEEKDVIIKKKKEKEHKEQELSRGRKGTKEQCVVFSLAHWLNLGSSLTPTLHTVKIPTMLKISHGYLASNVMVSTVSSRSFSTCMLPD